MYNTAEINETLRLIDATLLAAEDHGVKLNIAYKVRMMQRVSDLIEMAEGLGSGEIIDAALALLEKVESFQVETGVVNVECEPVVDIPRRETSRGGARVSLRVIQGRANDN